MIRPIAIAALAAGLIFSASCSSQTESDSGNLGVVESIYEAFADGDIPAILSSLDADVVWNEAENFPYADKNPYIGPDAVLDGVFARIGEEWNGWSIDIEDMHDAGDVIVVRGYYNGAHKGTGREINAQFVHVWSVRGGKVVQFQQYADTLQVVRAMGDDAP